MLPNGRNLVNIYFYGMLPIVMTRKNPAAVALGRRTSAAKKASSTKNAAKATRARMRLTPDERSAQAKRAAEARWAKP